MENEVSLLVIEFFYLTKYSQNALICGFESICDDDFIMLVDDSLPDNVFVLKYIPNNDDDNDIETIYSPDEKRIYVIV